MPTNFPQTHVDGEVWDGDATTGQETRAYAKMLELLSTANLVKSGSGPPQGSDTDAWYQDTSSTPPTLYYGGVKLLSVGRQVVVVGDADYVPKHTESEALIIMAPAAGVRRKVHVQTRATTFNADGDEFEIWCVGAGNVDFVYDAGVTPVPTDTRALSTGQRGELKTWSADQWVVTGGTTSTPAATAPVNTVPPVIALNGSTFSITDPGESNPKSTSKRYQWQRASTLSPPDWADISGATSATYTKTSTDDNHYVAVNVWYTANGVESVAPTRSGSLFVAASGAPVFATGFPKMVLAANGVQPTNDTVEVGDTVQIALGNPSGTGNTYSVEFFNPDNATPPNVVSRGTDTTAPYQYTPVTGDSGANGDEHIYATVTATNASGTTKADTQHVAVVPAGTLGPAPGTPPANRPSYFQQPFSDSSWVNTSIGSGAQFQAVAAGNLSSTITSIGGTAINCGQWSIPVSQAASGDPSATWAHKTGYSGPTKTVQTPNKATEPGGIIALPSGGDMHVAVVNVAQTLCDEAWNTSKQSSTSYTYGATGQIDLTGMAVGGGVRASNFPVMAGLLRQWEVNNGVINHCLLIGIPANAAKAGWVWPATNQDGYSGQYGGNIPLGSLFAIPGTVDLTTLGLSAAGMVLAKAFQNYGCRVGDTEAPNNGSNLLLNAEPALEGSAALTAMRADLSKIKAQLRYVTNDSETNIAGGGTRLPSPWGSGPTATTPVLDTPSDLAWATSDINFLTWSHVVGSGTNRLGIAAVLWAGTGTDDSLTILQKGTSTVVATMTAYDSVSVGSDFTARSIKLYDLTAIASGDYDFKTVLTSSNVAVAMVLISASNVLQATPLRTAGKATTASGTALDVSTTGGATTDLILAFCAARTASVMTVGAGQTKIADGISGSGGNLRVVATSQPGAAGTVHSTFAWTGADTGAAIAVALRSV